MIAFAIEKFASGGLLERRPRKSLLEFGNAAFFLLPLIGAMYVVFLPSTGVIINLF
jgi:hypothetical protein